MSESGGRKHIDLSVSQVAGGGLATLVAATAAAYLGVYGTIVGAAVMSVLSTAGTAVAQRFLKESGDRAKTLAERAKRPPRYRPPGDTRGATGTELGDRDATQAFPAVAGTTHPNDGPDERSVADTGVNETRAMPAVGGPGDASDDNGAGGSGDGGDGQDPAGDDPGFWRRWRTPIITAGVIFVLVMLVILAFELLTGRSLSDTVRGRDTHSGPSVLGGQSQEAPDTTPGQGPSPTPGTGTGAPQEGTTDQSRTPEPGGQPDPEGDPTGHPPPTPTDGDSDTGGDTGDGTGGDTGGQDDEPGSQDQKNSDDQNSGQGDAGMARPEAPPQE